MMVVVVVVVVIKHDPDPRSLWTKNEKKRTENNIWQSYIQLYEERTEHEFKKEREHDKDRDPLLGCLETKGTRRDRLVDGTNTRKVVRKERRRRTKQIHTILNRKLLSFIEKKKMHAIFLTLAHSY